MSFYDLAPVPQADELLDIAFRRAKKRAAQKSTKSRDPFKKKKEIEELRFESAATTLGSRLDAVARKFPSVDDFTPFYNELLHVTLDYVKLKKSFGALKWAKRKIGQLSTLYKRKVRGLTYEGKILGLRREFFGRISSVIKQIKEELAYLEVARRVFREFPIIKNMKTMAIAGFPNVGKSTLLGKLSSSKPKIAAYAFTTKKINVGYFLHDDKKLQLLDTPGTLNRPEKMNAIELQAHLAMKHVAHEIVYVFDLSGTYSLEKQEKLYKKLKRDHKKPMFIYISKTDITPKEDIEEFKKKHKQAMVDIKELKKKLETLTGHEETSYE